MSLGKQQNKVMIDYIIRCQMSQLLISYLFTSYGRNHHLESKENKKIPNIVSTQ